jgi:hypothetical protein
LKWASNEVAYLAFALALATIAALSWFSLRAVSPTPAEPEDGNPPEPPPTWSPGEAAGPS